MSGLAWRRLFQRSPRVPGERDIVVAEDLVTLLVDGVQACASPTPSRKGRVRACVSA
jgi:hypothetical protein